MPLNRNETPEQRVQRFRKYYKKENERPLLGFFIGSEYPLTRYSEFYYLPEDKPLTPDDFHVDALLRGSDRLYEEHERYGGDFLFAATAFWGIPWLEASLGCAIYANHATGSIYSTPPAEFKTASDIPVFDPSNPWLKKMSDFYDALCEHSNGRYPVGTTRFRGVSDLLAALYGGEELVYRMLDQAEDMQQAAEKLTDYYIAASKLQLAHIKLYMGGVGSFYYYMWAPAGTVWYQEDTVALLSPTLYEEFIEPCVNRIVAELEHVIIHAHPTGFIPFKSYAEAGVTAMEMHIDSGGPSAENLFETHKYIMKKVPLLVWGDLTEADFKWIMENLPPQGLALIVVVNKLEEADHYWKTLNHYYK